MSNHQIYSVLEWIKKSPFLRLILIAVLILLLQIPVGMIAGVIRERQMTRNQAVSEVTSKWGKKQCVAGPMIIVPYTARWSELSNDKTVRTRSEQKFAGFFPDSLNISGNMQTDILYRGIYQVPVYKLSLNFSGRFSRPDFSAWGLDSGEGAPDRSYEIHWDRAYLSVRISDASAIKSHAQLRWNERQLDFLPGSGEFSIGTPGIHVSLNSLLDEENYEFSFPLSLNGSEGAFFAPFGRDTQVDLSSTWREPSFQGNWLPVERSVTDEGFQASWNIPSLGRNYPLRWKSKSGTEQLIESSWFGVDLLTPVDHYRMTDRSVKYALLFLVLTFTALWLFEVLGKSRIHPVQYLMVGAGMCVFYLLELSLSEHIGFITAYVLASAAVIVLIAAYCAAILKSAFRAALIGAVVSVLYGYLYVLLKAQDYSLLLGSLGLFLIIALMMYLTRNVDWFAASNSITVGENETEST